jgi:D-aminopeptidase
MFPGVVTAVVKQAETAELPTGLDQKAAHREVERKVAEAIEKARTRQLKLFKPALPMTVTVRMRTMEGAAKIAKKPGVIPLDDHTVEVRVGRYCDILKWLNGAEYGITPRL